MDIEIFPHRILGADTTEKLLNDIESLDEVRRTVIQGPRLPPQDEIDRRYGDRRVITVRGKELELKVKTGRIWAELFDEDGIDKIRDICSEHIVNGFEINTNREQYIRKSRTVTDDLKYGSRTAIPDEFIGLSDQRSQFNDNVAILRRDESE